MAVEYKIIKKAKIYDGFFQLHEITLKHKKHIKQKIVINFLSSFSNGKIKKVRRNATKLVPIANSCGFAVNVKNKKLGMHKIAKHIRILLFVFK